MSDTHPPEEDNRSNPAGRRDYDDIAKNIGLYTDKTERRLSKFFKGAIIALAIIGLATAGALAGFGIVLNQQQETQDQIKELVESNRALVRDIQNQRASSIRRSCNSQNARNESTKDALIKGSDEDQDNADTEAQKAEIRRRRDVTLALIDALAPVEDCEAAVKNAVQKGG